MHAQDTSEPNPKVSSQNDLGVTQFRMGDTRAYHTFLCHFCDDQGHPPIPLALWSALMVVLVEMEFSSSSYEPNKLTHTHAHHDTHTYVFMSCSTSISS